MRRYEVKEKGRKEGIKNRREKANSFSVYLLFTSFSKSEKSNISQKPEHGRPNSNAKTNINYRNVEQTMRTKETITQR